MRTRIQLAGRDHRKLTRRYPVNEHENENFLMKMKISEKILHHLNCTKLTLNFIERVVATFWAKPFRLLLFCVLAIRT